MDTKLKLQNKDVLIFNLEDNKFEVIDNNLLPYSLRDFIKDSRDIEKLTDKEKIKAITSNVLLLENFFKNRSLSVKRENAKYIMNQLDIKQNNEFESTFKAMILCKALSVSDDYWITNSEEKWEDINLRNNPLHEVLQQIALFGKSLSITGKITSAELTGQGAYAKAWYRENGRLFLYKASSKGGNESEREVVASNILDCFNIPHVKYELAQKDNLTVCKCENMNTLSTSIVEAIEFDIWCSKKELNFIDECRKIDEELYYKTIVIDYLIANSDRHGSNWGFYMDNQTGKIIRMHPLFDHNNAFDENFMDDPTGGICQLMPGKNMKEAALYAINKCDLRCIKPVTRKMFMTNKQYKTFMNRCEELGLYKKSSITLKNLLHNNKLEQYTPVKISNDNTKDYWNTIININDKNKNIKEYKNKGVDYGRE